jgi:hypothetical protein
MPRRPRARRRVLLPIVLATILAGEVAGLAAAARDGRAAAGPGAHVPPASAAQIHGAPGGGGSAPSPRPAAASLADPRSAAITEHVRPDWNRGAVGRPELAAEANTVSTGAGTRVGRNHVWIPALGISRSVVAFPCDRAQPPDNHIYRWGCAGRNNVYLLGHAYSVFKPLHDAYASGRLQKGMTVDYADGDGHVRTYAVAWWKITRPTGAASWAWAPQSRPSMTLQTCVGADSEYRLMVRLVATD